MSGTVTATLSFSTQGLINNSDIHISRLSLLQEVCEYE
jgi:hypothetical protein